MLMLTAFTLNPQEALFETAALESSGARMHRLRTEGWKGFELVLYITRQRPVLRFHRRQEVRVVSFDYLIEKGLFRSVAFIVRHGSPFGIPCREHDAIRCIANLLSLYGWRPFRGKYIPKVHLQTLTSLTHLQASLGSKPIAVPKV